MNWQEQIERYRRENELRNAKAEKENRQLIEDLEARRIAAEEQIEERKQRGYGLGSVLLAGIAGYWFGRNSSKQS